MPACYRHPQLHTISTPNVQRVETVTENQKAEMIIPDDPHKGLLDDETATAFASQQLKLWTNLLRDLANYGSNLIPRAFSSSGKMLGDAVLIGILLRQLVAMIDAIEILLCRSAVHAATLQLRAMFEAAVYIEWMLAGDRENKAAHYYVHNLLRLRVWAMRVQSGTPESLNFKSVMNGLPVDDTLGDEGKSHVQEIDRVLSQARFVAVRDGFRDWKKRNGRRPTWYSPLGVTDLRNMAIKVNKEPLYVIVYGSASEVMHASNYGQHIRIQSERITFYSIRHPKEFSTTVRLTATIAIDTFRKILHEYREGERPRFDQKYVEKWRQAFMNMPQLKIDERDLGV
jgi:hypothetical protein